MLSWTAPLILLGLLLLPLVRLLHRRRDQREAQDVSALFLWPARDSDLGTRENPARVDPRWWLRAAIAGLMIVGLAGPQLEQPGPRRIAVYFDDAPSMAARESDGPRLRQAARAVAQSVAQERSDGEATVVLHSLARPGRQLELEQMDENALARNIENWVSPTPRRVPLPSAEVLPPDSERWLVSDGVDPEVLAWSRTAGFDRVLYVGKSSENVGLTRLATRPQVDGQRGLAGIVQVLSAGRETARRRLRVWLPERVVLDEEIELAPGALWQGDFEVPFDSRGPLRAELALSGASSGSSPAPQFGSVADAMAGDDSLELGELVAPRRPVLLDSRCGPHLISAIRAHPGLRVSEERDAFLAVSCGADPPSGAVPALWFRPGAGNLPLRVERSPRRVEIRRDMEDAVWVREPGYIAFIAEQLDRLAGEPLLERGRSVSLDEANGWDRVRVAPGRAETESKARPLASVPSERRDLTGSAAALAMLLLLVDLRSVARRGD